VGTAFRIETVGFVLFPPVEDNVHTPSGPRKSGIPVTALDTKSRTLPDYIGDPIATL
jgi:hypothetical protein